MTPLDAETRALLAQHVLTAQRKHPHLAVTVTPHAGKRWVVDYCCQRVWINASLSAVDLITALREALDDLHKHLQHPTLAIPAQRSHSPVGVP